MSFALGDPPRGTLPYASDLARRLRERDFAVFLCEDDLPPGHRLWAAVDRVLDRSKVLVVIVNRHLLLNPGSVRREVERFRRTHADAGNEDGCLLLVDGVTGPVGVGKPQCRHDGKKVTSIAFEPKGAVIVSGGSDNTLWRWDLKTGAAIAPPLQGHANTVESVAVSPDGRRIASGACDGQVRLWDLASGKALGEPMPAAIPYTCQCAGLPVPADAGVADARARSCNPRQ